MTILDEVARRGIQEVVHFTTNRGLVGTLAVHALLSRRVLPQEAYLEHVLHPNARFRPEEAALFDKSEDWLDFVNLSLSEINSRFFRVSEGWHTDQAVWWAILSFDPAILGHEGVYFGTTNNGYDHCERAQGVAGFSSLFKSPIRRKTNWSVSRINRGDSLPTCEQAEVLYPNRVAAEHLKRIYVRTGDDGDRARGFVREFGYDEIEVVHEPAKFVGIPN